MPSLSAPGEGNTRAFPSGRATVRAVSKPRSFLVFSGESRTITKNDREWRRRGVADSPADATEPRAERTAHPGTRRSGANYFLLAAAALAFVACCDVMSACFF